MLELKDSQYKIPFKELEWRDNVTDIGKERGYIHFIGEFKTNNYTFRYNVVNSYADKSPQEKIMAFQYDDTKIGECDTVDDAKKACQLHFQKFIMETFFNI